jgi:hypothetical protein
MDFGDDHYESSENDEPILHVLSDTDHSMPANPSRNMPNIIGKSLS